MCAMSQHPGSSYKYDGQLAEMTRWLSLTWVRPARTQPDQLQCSLAQHLTLRDLLFSLSTLFGNADVAGGCL